MIQLDGSQGEGGGQILRSSLSLSAVTGQPFELVRIRAGRARPGLLRQHLCSVQIAAALCGADVDGAALGSTSLRFRPGTLRGGQHRVEIGSAGAASLVLQTALPILLAGPERATVTVTGGTHNPSAPPFDFLDTAFLPILRAAGADLTATLRAHGFYPAGGGEVVLETTPAALAPIEIVERGAIESIEVRAIVSAISGRVGVREVETAVQRLSRLDVPIEGKMVGVRDPRGPGNAVCVVMRAAGVTETFTAFGEKGRPAEQVAIDAASQALQWAGSGAPVGEHLADQLLLPMALHGGGVFRTGPPSSHLTTNIEVIRRFLDVPISVDGGLVRVGRA